MQWKYTSANTKQHVCRKCTNNAADPWFTLHPLALAALSVGHITDSPLYMPSVRSKQQQGSDALQDTATQWCGHAVTPADLALPYALTRFIQS